MTTTDFGGYPPPPAPSPARTRRLRRSRDDRVGAGVAGGLGEYFGLDPVLFRVLFATAAFFGGAGILAYLLSWAAIPDEGTERAAIDGWMSSLRRRRVPFWVVAIGAGLVLWLIAFSWWAPGPFFPVLAVVVLLVVAFTRRGRRVPMPDSATAPVSLQKSETGSSSPAVADARGWLAESLAASRMRRHRAAPVRIATLVTLAVTLVVLGIVDAAHGILFPAYAWTTLGIVLAGLIVGAVLRRTPWTIGLLLVPAAIAVFVFGGTRASLHDGVGQHTWQPTSSLVANYRLAFGQGVLDLRSLQAQSQGHTVHVRLAGGQIRILAPKTLDLTVHANVHLGQVSVDGSDFDPALGRTSGGMNYNRTVRPLAGATGTPLTVDVTVAAGTVEIVRS